MNLLLYCQNCGCQQFTQDAISEISSCARCCNPSFVNDPRKVISWFDEVEETSTRPSFQPIVIWIALMNMKALSLTLVRPIVAYLQQLRWPLTLSGVLLSSSKTNPGNGNQSLTASMWPKTPWLRSCQLSEANCIQTRCLQ